MKLIAAALLAALILWIPPAAQAQAPAPVVIAGTVPISSDVRDALAAYLAENPPSSAPFYAPTYTRAQSTYTLVSLAGLQLASAADPWQLESSDTTPGNVIWTGTVRIYADGSGSLYSTPMGTARKLPKMAVPLLPLVLPAPGGGPQIRLPFQPGRSAQYGPRLVHGSGDYGTTGMYAVDLVGGDSLGSNVTSAAVFASFAGTVDYVCDDDTSVAIRTYNDATDDYFVYAHLLDNANLEIDHEFTAGAIIGSLKYGSFDDTCGWAEQGDTVYHDHWMFEPAGGAYRVGNYSISISDKKFHTGNTAIGAGGWIVNNPTSSGADDPTAGTTQTPSFWDNIVNAIGGVAASISGILPPHNVITLFVGASNTVVLVIRLAYVLLRGNLNLTVAIAAILAAIAFRLLMSVPWGIFAVVRVLRILKQLISPLG